MFWAEKRGIFRIKEEEREVVLGGFSGDFFSIFWGDFGLFFEVFLGHFWDDFGDILRYFLTVF